MIIVFIAIYSPLAGHVGKNYWNCAILWQVFAQFPKQNFTFVVLLKFSVGSYFQQAINSTSRPFYASEFSFDGD